jgi:hypothetical protein
LFRIAQHFRLLRIVIRDAVAPAIKPARFYGRNTFSIISRNTLDLKKAGHFEVDFANISPLKSESCVSVASARATWWPRVSSLS